MKQEQLLSLLEKIQERIRTQDHKWHATRNPMYLVRREHLVVTTEDYSSDYAYYDHENLWEIGRNKEALIKEIKDEDLTEKCPLDLETASEEDIWEWYYDYREHGVSKHYIEEVDVYVDIFFTEQGAKDYIERHKHNSNYNLYVVSACYNEELQVLQQFLAQVDLSSIKFTEGEKE